MAEVSYYYIYKDATGNGAGASLQKMEK